MTENRYKLANPNNLFKDMNIGIVENNTCMLKLIDVVELLNNLSDENEKLKQYNEEEIKFISDISGIHRSALLDSEYNIKKLEEENEQLKQDIKYLEEKIKENEWHWNTIDEDRDVWHYKCNQAEERVKELKDENEQLKQCNEKLDEKYGRMLMEYNGLGCEYTELQEENEQLKKENKHLRCTIESNSQDDYIDYLEKQNGRLKERIEELATNDKIVFMVNE